MGKRARLPKDSFVPGDGWIILEPGAWVHWDVDTPCEPNSTALQEWMRRLRGLYLSTAFDLEEQLLKLSLADKFGTNDASVGGEEYRSQEAAWRAQHSFGNMVKRAKPIVRGLLDKPDADELVHKLAAARDLRNLVAHYPCWMVPVNDETIHRTVSMELYIADSSHVWIVDNEQAAQWGKLLTECRIGVENLVRTILGVALLLPDGSPPPAGTP